MKTLIILVTIFIFSCGENPLQNSINNPPTSQDSLIYSLDSVRVWSNFGTRNFWERGSYDSCRLKTFKIEFIAQTNCPDTSLSYFGFEILNSNIPSQNYAIVKKGNAINQTFNQTITLPISIFPYHLAYGITGGFYSANGFSYYVLVKNVKIYIIH